MPVATLTRKYQATIPKQIRDHLHLHSGDRVEFQIGAQGQVSVRPLTTDVTELDGLLQSKVRQPVTVEAMNTAIAQSAGRMP
jgi:AbrB family looped-hinge helix DNA binding protein